MRIASNYSNTSADDCKISLKFCVSEDIPMLNEALAICESRKQKTHIKHLTARIKQLEKPATGGGLT